METGKFCRWCIDVASSHDAVVVIAKPGVRHVDQMAVMKCWTHVTISEFPGRCMDVCVGAGLKPAPTVVDVSCRDETSRQGCVWEYDRKRITVEQILLFQFKDLDHGLRMSYYA